MRMNPYDLENEFAVLPVNSVLFIVANSTVITMGTKTYKAREKSGRKDKKWVDHQKSGKHIPRKKIPMNTKRSIFIM